MSDTPSGLRRKIDSASDLHSVVRTMKALTASSIGQFEQSIHALSDYYRAVELGLHACLRNQDSGSAVPAKTIRNDERPVGAVVFGSDQGLVGQFNEAVADFAVKTLATFPGKPVVWAVGERIHARLSEAGLSMQGLFSVPTSVRGISPLVSQIQIEAEAPKFQDAFSSVYVFHNRPESGSLFEPVAARLLPLDATWRQQVTELPWPSKSLPEVLGNTDATLFALIREYLFISVFRACAESLASENASRLAGMERAEKNIDEVLEGLQSNFHRLRQSNIDEELFDVISGFEALGGPHETR